MCQWMYDYGSAQVAQGARELTLNAKVGFKSYSGCGVGVMVGVGNVLPLLLC